MKGLTVTDFHRRLNELLDEVRDGDLNTPTNGIADTMVVAAEKLYKSGTNFMHQLEGRKDNT